MSDENPSRDLAEEHEVAEAACIRRPFNRSVTARDITLAQSGRFLIILGSIRLGHGNRASLAWKLGRA